MIARPGSGALGFALILVVAGQIFARPAPSAPTGAPAATARSEPAPGQIHGVVVSSGAVEDVSSLEAIRSRVAQAGDDEAKAKEIFRLAVKFRHQTNPAREYLAQPDHVHDPIKIFNVYGYSQCCCAAAALAALGRDNGLEARGWALSGHSVSELSHDGRMHMYDPSLINYFVTDEGRVASVAELARQRDRIFDAGHSPFIDEKGWYPARTAQAAVAGPEEYDPAVIHTHEHLFTLGYRAGVTLRRGEVLERRWGNTDRYLNEDDPNPYHPSLTDIGPTRDQVYLEQFFPGYRMGLVGNGSLAWAPDLASGKYRGGILSENNLATTADDGHEPALHLMTPGRGEVIFPVTSAYVFLGGSLRARVILPSPGDAAEISLSMNHGLDWKSIWRADKRGNHEVEADLSPWIFRRYHYLVRVTLKGDAPGLASFALIQEIQHSQRALPLLLEGENTITVRSDGPRLASRVIEGTLTPANDLNASFRDFHPDLVRIKADGVLRVTAGRTGTVTFRVPVPGEVRAVRLGGAFRLNAVDSGLRFLVSDDGGHTWKVAAHVMGPQPDSSRFVRFDAIRPGTTEVMIRYELSGHKGVELHTLRADVDYEDPKAGVIPIKILYEWTEEGQLRHDERIVTSLPTTYTITAGRNPVMRVLRLEGL